jgi:hypothetical protein
MNCVQSAAWRRAFLIALAIFGLSTLVLVQVGRTMITEAQQQAAEARAEAEQARLAAEASQRQAAELQTQLERKFLARERKAKVFVESGLAEALVQFLSDDPEALVNAILSITVVE